MGVVVLELSPNDRFVGAIRARAPVLTGDARLPEDLERASIGRAIGFIACTDNDLANIQACLHAHRSNPDIVTVARVFDDALAERLTQTFTISKALSASQVAVGAFVGAALDERAVRSFPVGDLSLLAFRYTAQASVSAEEIAVWRSRGVRVLAFRVASGPVRPPSALTSDLPPGAEAILCGPASAVQSIVDDVPSAT